MTTKVSYRAAAEVLWGGAGVYVHDAYAHLRAKHFPDLPDELPIVIGITAYGACRGLTRLDWSSGPRISVASNLFGQGRLRVDDTVLHEMLHADLFLAGRDTEHQGDDWYAEVRRLSPAVLGHPLDVHRGGHRRSVRVPNPAREIDPAAPATVVRKQLVPGAVPHGDVARWPGAFRSPGYDYGAPVLCPSY